MSSSGLQRKDPPAKRSKGTAAQAHKFALKTRAPKVDTGYVDLAAAAYACDTTGSITLLATIAQGASVNQRVGKRAQYKSIQFRGYWGANTTSTVTDGTVIVVYDRRPTGALPNITDVLNTVNSLSFNNDTNSGRFKIVRRWDQTFLGNITTPTTGKEAVSFDQFINAKGLNVVFKAAGTGAIGDIEEGALYLITCGATAAGTAASTLSVGCRVRFVDV